MELHRKLEIEFSNDVWVIYLEKLILNQEYSSVHGQVLLAIHDLVSGFILHISVVGLASAREVINGLETAMRKFGLPNCIVIENKTIHKKKLAFLEEDLGIQIKDEVFYRKKDKDIRLENYLNQIGRTLKPYPLEENLEKKAVLQAMRWNNCFRYGGRVPKNRYLRDLGEFVLLDKGPIQECFLARTRRTVKANGTIYIVGRSYAVPRKFISQMTGQKLFVRIDIKERSKVFLYERNGEFLGVCTELNE